MLINGRPGTRVAAADRGLHYGDGVFETLAVRDGVPCLWRRHMQRLQLGCRRLGIAAPDPQRLLAEAHRVIGDVRRCVLKILVTRGPGGRGYDPARAGPPTRILGRNPWPEWPGNPRETGVKVRICDTRLGMNRALAGLKTLNRLEQVMARSEWSDPGTAEGLMMDWEGRVIEGTATNLFLRRGGAWITPELTRCGTAGVMRGLVIDTARSLGLVMREEDVTLDRLRKAEAVLLSNSLIGLWPVRELPGHHLPAGAGGDGLAEAVMTEAYRP